MKPERIGARLKKIPGWTPESIDQAIVRTFHFPGIGEALCFVNDVAHMSREADHYPVIELHIGQVKIRLTSPGADGLTDLDFDLAEIFDHLATVAHPND